ncbi:DUF4249 domain-containing protein [Paradesertivirga mongoliensis]|uniref:DUF4249 domain-containing protein n=1 Tax=Paradesertivirga mongoliensis TaxID=2100740 RepID=A0ABW4ZNA2_9SPHI|nr:DUF4249 domain-containing protein [Pedobacter mongoliensis]
MNHVVKIFFLGLAGFLFASCEKVLDVELKDAAPIIVIEGVVTNRADSQIVKINRSVPFGEPNVFPDVTGALVTIKENPSGRVVTIRERRPGYYMARNFTGRSGSTYELTVDVDGKIYTASSRMPNQVSIDSLGVSVSTIFGEQKKTVQLMYKDPGSEKNYYRFVLRVNEIPSKNIFTYDDSFTNGRSVNRELFDFDLDAETGDKAEIEMQCIDAAVYRYWQGLDQNQSRGGASTTPANPASNIRGGALGYFSAHTRQNEALVIP